VAHDLVVIPHDFEVLEFTRAKTVYGHVNLPLWSNLFCLTSMFDLICRRTTSVGNRGSVSLIFPAYSQPDQFPRKCLSAKLFAEFPP
jgi:hypothetical protein